MLTSNAGLIGHLEAEQRIVHRGDFLEPHPLQELEVSAFSQTDRLVNLLRNCQRPERGIAEVTEANVPVPTVINRFAYHLDCLLIVGIGRVHRQKVERLAGDDGPALSPLRLQVRVPGDHVAEYREQHPRLAALGSPHGGVDPGHVNRLSEILRLAKTGLAGNAMEGYRLGCEITLRGGRLGEMGCNGRLPAFPNFPSATYVVS